LLSYGIDLSGTEKRKSGISTLRENLIVNARLLTSDSEIVKDVKERKPDIVAIDAPLSMPRGRRSLDDRRGPHLRACDEELLRMKIRFFPITLGPMRSLTVRGMSLKNQLDSEGFEVIEVYPGAAQDMLGIPRKQVGLGCLMNGLSKLEIKEIPSGVTGDELDAITAAYVGLLVLLGKAKGLGDPDEGLIYVPDVWESHKPHSR